MATSSTPDFRDQLWALASAAARLVGYFVAATVSVVVFIVFVWFTSARQTIGRHAVNPAVKGLRKASADFTTALVLASRGGTASYTRFTRTRETGREKAVLVAAGVVVVLLVVWLLGTAFTAVRSGLGMTQPAREEVLASTGGQLPQTPQQFTALLQEQSPFDVGAAYGASAADLPNVGPVPAVATEYAELASSPSPPATVRTDLIRGYRSGLCMSLPLSCLPATVTEFDAAVTALTAGTSVASVNPWMAGQRTSGPPRTWLVTQYVEARTGLPWVGDDVTTISAGVAADAAYRSGQTDARSSSLSAVYARLRADN